MRYTEPRQETDSMPTLQQTDPATGEETWVTAQGQAFTGPAATIVDGVRTPGQGQLDAIAAEDAAAPDGPAVPAADEETPEGGPSF